MSFDRDRAYGPMMKEQREQDAMRKAAMEQFTVTVDSKIARELVNLGFRYRSTADGRYEFDTPQAQSDYLNFVTPFLNAGMGQPPRPGSTPTPVTQRDVQKSYDRAGERGDVANLFDLSGLDAATVERLERLRSRDFMAYCVALGNARADAREKQRQ